VSIGSSLWLLLERSWKPFHLFAPPSEARPPPARLARTATSTPDTSDGEGRVQEKNFMRTSAMDNWLDEYIWPQIQIAQVCV
jgi:hypothetical protein